jgi:hypothetical protein
MKSTLELTEKAILDRLTHGPIPATHVGGRHGYSEKAMKNLIKRGFVRLVVTNGGRKGHYEFTTPDQSPFRRLEKIFLDAFACFANGDCHRLDLKKGRELPAERLTEPQCFQAAMDYILFLSSEQEQVLDQFKRFYDTVYIPHVDRPSLAGIPPIDIIHFVSPQTARSEGYVAGNCPD